MKETFNHKLYSSFFLWFDHVLCTTGEAYTSGVTKFYPSENTEYPGYKIFTSPYKQFVYDSSVPAPVLSGIAPIGSNNFIGRGTSGVMLDYINGRIFTSTGVNVTGFSGVYSKKEFNIYNTNKDSQEFIFEKVMDNNKNLNKMNTGIGEEYAAPCVILTYANSFNEGFTFGGQDKTESTIRAIIISKDIWQQEGIQSIFRDTNHLPIPIIPAEEIPLNYFNDLKTGYYNYNELIDKYAAPGQMPWINRVYAGKVSEDANKNDNYFVSYLEFDINTVRYSRQNF